MATIGMDKLYYAAITDGANGETYGSPALIGKAMSADLSISYAEGELYGDDMLAESVREFQSGTITLGTTNLDASVVAALTGARVDSHGALIDASEDSRPYVAVGFRAKKSDGKYKYVWLYRVQFSTPSEKAATKGNSIAFATPTIEGKIYARNKVVGTKHPWKATIDESESGVDASAITAWFSAVYEPAAPTP